MHCFAVGRLHRKRMHLTHAIRHFVHEWPGTKTTREVWNRVRHIIHDLRNHRHVSRDHVTTCSFWRETFFLHAALPRLLYALPWWLLLSCSCMTDEILLSGKKQMSFHDNKNSFSRNATPINNLVQQLGKFREEKSKTTTNKFTSGLLTSTKHKIQGQG